MVYFDDIFIYNKNLKEHVEHWVNVLVVLQKQCVYATMKMCDFVMENISFLGYIVSVKGIEMNEENVKAN